MKFIYYPNPLRNKVVLDENEKEIFRLKYKEEQLKDIIFSVKYHLDKDPNEKKQCPNPYYNGKTNYELAKQEIPDNIYSKEEEDNFIKMANHYIDDLGSFHAGDCTCIPCSCAKCYAESILGVDTIPGLGKHEASKIWNYFVPDWRSPFDLRTIDEVLELLRTYEPKISEAWESCSQETFDHHAPRWRQEARNAYNWLYNYKMEHGF